jgi:hypothetical protein
MKKKPVLSKSQAAKQAASGKDMGKPNKNPFTTGFDAVEGKAASAYGSKAAGQKVAGSVFQKMRAKGQL